MVRSGDGYCMNPIYSSLGALLASMVRDPAAARLRTLCRTLSLLSALLSSTKPSIHRNPQSGDGFIRCLIEPARCYLSLSRDCDDNLATIYSTAAHPLFRLTMNVFWRRRWMEVMG